MIDEYSIPQNWKRALEKLRQGGFPEAIIAGGALRDLDHGRPVKDVDIFVLDRGIWTEAMLTAALDRPASSRLEPATSDYAFGRPERPVVGLYGFDDCASAPLEVIVLQKPDDPSIFFPAYVMQDFDLGLCRTWFDGTKWHRTAEYERDRKAKQFTACVPLRGEQLDRTKDRIRRLREKYPEFQSTIEKEAA